MDTLPLELHAQIFEFACDDDGTAAASLARVSRYVHDVARPFRYQSLAVAGLPALAKLADTLEGLPQHRRRVRNLFLSDRSRKQSLLPTQTISPAEDVDCDSDAAESHITRILDIIAPTLETLTFIALDPYTSTSLIGHLFSLRLPRLHSLSVHGFYPFPYLSHSMPRLERLRLSGNRNPHGLLQTGGLSAACPNLRELDVEGLVGAGTFVQELERVVLPDRAGESPRRLEAVLPSTLRTIVVSTGAVPSNGRRTATQQEKMLVGLENLVRSSALLLDGVRVQCGGEVKNGDVYAEWRRRWGVSC